jgi:hypothetical protein
LRGQRYSAQNLPGNAQAWFFRGFLRERKAVQRVENLVALPQP